MIFQKPKFWDNKELNFILFLLFPLTIPIRLNNFLFNFSSKLKTKKIMSICVGNIYLGGTGKTPTTIRLYEILNSLKIKTVTAKKFYSSHFDESILLQKKTKFLTGKSRLEIVNRAIKKKNKIVIFDDGLQDKNIDYNLKFVCFDALSWVGNGHLIPSGPLREQLHSLKRFDGVFIKNIGKANHNIITIIKNINPNIQIFNSKYKIKNLSKFNLSKKYIAFSGIGNPDNFKKLLEKHKFSIVDHIIFPDHYKYNKYDISKILQKANELKVDIITTEKDYVKIPKTYHRKINFIDIDLAIDNKQKLIKFLKLKINA